jgi:uncharacterized repeat protein (TIGR03803 family)
MTRLPLFSAALGAALVVTAQEYRVLHHFAAGAAGGAYPGYESPALVGTNLFGMVAGGGTRNYGAVFRMGEDGSAYTNLHSFTGWPDGNAGEGGLLAVGSDLYGMSSSGGGLGGGTVFRLGLDGSGYAILLHMDAYSTGSGQAPLGSLARVGPDLYGLTFGGGAHGAGTLFRLGTNGASFAMLHSFAQSATNGCNPFGHVTPVGEHLYGLTSIGGAYGLGTVFRIGTNGADFTILHAFAGHGGRDGGVPYGSLAWDGAALYGVTAARGPNPSYDRGAVFRISPDGSGYTNLLAFGPDDLGGAGMGTPVVTNGVLYGMTTSRLFQVNTNGSGAAVLRAFAGAPADGGDIQGGLALRRRTLYGWTRTGGSANCGTVFSYALAAVPGADSVGDGVTDLWRQQHFGGDGTTTNASSCATSDPDGDGFPNAAEFGAGTAPTNAASVLRIVGLEAGAGGRTLRWTTAGGRTNYVQAAASPRATFETISPPIAVQGAGDAATNYFDMDGAPTTRFYRIRVAP